MTDNSHTGLSRRDFVRQTALAGAVSTAVVGDAALGVQGRTVRAGPNDRIHLGLIGCGAMGRENLAACAGQNDVAITGACDVWKERRDAVVADHAKTCKPYHDFREMLAQADIDAVIIATPPHWHTLMTIEACRAGKDVYLQKPMTMHLGESLAVNNAVKKHGIISQVGTQIHAGENFRRVVEYVRSGNLGPIGVVRTFHVMNQGPEGVGRAASTSPPDGLDWEFWVGPAPLRPFNPIIVRDASFQSSWMDYSNGWTATMAPHILDLPVWAMDLGYPTLTSCLGGRYVIQDDGDAYDVQEALWQYPSLTVTWMSTIASSFGFNLGGSALKRQLGIYFHGVNGTLYADYDTHKIVPEANRMDGMQPPPKSIEPSPGHEREWLDCIKSRQQPSCSVAYHSRVNVPIQLAILSYRLGRSIRFDPQKQAIVNDREATRLAVPEYRGSWKFPHEYLS